MKERYFLIEILIFKHSIKILKIIQGKRRVRATTSGNERTRISAAFSATASGIKLPIYMIIPRKTDLPNFSPPNNCN
jgi:hypothetical protein